VAPVQVGARLFSFPRVQEAAVIGSGKLIERKQHLFFTGNLLLPGGDFPAGDFDAVFPGHLFYRLGKGEMFKLHQEGKNITPGVAAEAVEYLLCLAYRERRIVFCVERAEAPVIYPIFFQ